MMDGQSVANGVSLSVDESIFGYSSLTFVDIKVKISGSTNVTTSAIG